MKKYKYIIIGIIFAAIVFPLSAHAAKPIGEITALRGTARIFREAVPRPIPVYTGMSVYLQDRVTTGANSSLRIELIDGSILSLGEKADLDLDKFEFHPKKKKRSAFFKIALGKLRIFARDLMKFRERDFKIGTPTAVVGVRGTLFMVWVEKVDSTIITKVVCFEGMTQVTSAFDPSQYVDLTGGYSTDVLGPNPPTKPVLLTQEQLIELLKGLLPLTYTTPGTTTTTTTTSTTSTTTTTTSTTTTTTTTEPTTTSTTITTTTTTVPTTTSTTTTTTTTLPALPGPPLPPSG